MKINIAASHRFHLLDLARELEKQGHDVRFYSYVPTKRCMQFGLSKKASKWMWWTLPFVLLEKKFPKLYLLKKIKYNIIDFSVAVLMGKSDVFIALSGLYIKAAEKAKRMGTNVILERGSKHSLEQKRILENIPSLKFKDPVPDINVKRNLKGYAIADFVAVASTHVKESFLKHQYPIEKLFVNPYGVDLSMFYPISGTEKKYDVIMVGGWSYRKGCDLIIEAIQKLQINFLHVGSIVDLEFPKNNPLFTHVDSVNQKELIKYYNQAKIFLLPSREEGLAMVQMQAVSCNLPLICSQDSGGADLKTYFGDSKAIVVLEELNSDRIVEAINKMLIFINDQPKDYVFYDMSGKEKLSWQSYGKRYDQFLEQILK